MSHVGTVIQNYRLTHELGVGGFGAVYAAQHETLDRRAAVKVLAAELSRRPEIVARFVQEAKAAAAIHHAAIVEVLDVGQLPGGQHYIIMEYLDGRSLADVIEREGALPLARARELFEPIYSAIAAAHERGIIHRDLKPDNIMVMTGGVKVIDFGIAKLADAKLTNTGAMMGTLAYMAPEQAHDASRVDERADVYGLAATMWAALAGRAPFEATTVAELLRKMLEEPAPRLGALRPEVPPALTDALARHLAKDPPLRPASVAEAWLELATALPPVERSMSEPKREVGPSSRARSAPRRMRWVGPVVAIVALGGLGAGGLLLLRPRQAPVMAPVAVAAADAAAVAAVAAAGATAAAVDARPRCEDLQVVCDGVDGDGRPLPPLGTPGPNEGAAPDQIVALSRRDATVQLHCGVRNLGTTPTPDMSFWPRGTLRPPQPIGTLMPGETRAVDVHSFAPFANAARRVALAPTVYGASCAVATVPLNLEVHE